MRTLINLHATSSSKITTPLPSSPPTTRTSFSTPPAIVQKSPWHSPVPYFLVGLAAMLGLIAFALLLLACSYCRLSSNLNNEENGERDIEQGRDDKSDNATTHVVIMAGDVKPTYLATPIMSSTKASSFADGMKKNENCGKEMEEINVEKPKHEVTDDDNRHDDQTRRSQETGQESQEQNWPVN